MKPRLKRFLFWGLLGFTGLLALGILFFLSDEPPPPVDDLLLVRREPAPGQNGFDAVNFPPHALDLSKDECNACRLEASFWNAGKAAELVANHGDALARFEDALAAQDFVVPEAATKANYLDLWRQLDHLAEARAGLAFESGREREGMVEAMKLIRFGHRIQAAQGNLTTYRVGTATKDMGMRCLRVMARRTRLESAALRDLIVALGSASPDRRSWGDAVKVDFMRMSRTIEWVSKGDVNAIGENPGWKSWWATRLLRPHWTKRLLAEHYRDLLRGPAWELEHVQFVRPPPKNAFEISIPNAFGIILRDQAVEQTSGALFRLYKEDLEVSVTRLLLAIRSWRADRADTHELPKSLDDLVPSYIEAVPADPFDGKHLRYSQERRTIWSVGNDREDDGGEQEAELVKFGEFDDTEPTYGIDPPTN